ncbi:MAG: NAD(P)-dependent oxidoreductase, partial [Rhizobiales bacterium]|nr:NAD(P)-dependent oxidoreductase [Hyphomicrobiales bacterium]
MANSPIRKIAFLGTGIMGAPMAGHLARAGFVVTAWNRTSEKARALTGEGARIASKPSEAVQDADAVITMLTDGAAVGEVIFGLGCAEAAPPGALFIDCSSIAPALAREHAARLAGLDRSQIDAPVSGGESGACAASLAIMVGGEAAAVERALPVLSCLGQVTRVGPNGAGQLAKLANQAIVGITIAAVSEALLLASAGGADPAAFRRAVSGGFASSRVLDEHGARMIERDFVPGGRCSVHLKDMDNILTAASKFGIDLPLCRSIRAQFAALTNDLGRGDCDHSALLLWLESINAP